MCTSGVCPEHKPDTEEVSVPADNLDSLVQQASVPNLASLFKQAKQSGIITAGKEYGST